MKQLIDDPYHGNDFGDREIGINDEFSRLDLEIFAEAARMDFPLDKFPECKYPDTMEFYTMEQAHEIAKEIFESNIKYTHPYIVNFWGKRHDILNYARKHTTCGIRINNQGIRFEDRHDHAIVYLKFKKPYRYDPTLYIVKIIIDDFDIDFEDTRIQKMKEWIKENLGEFNWVLDLEYTIFHEGEFAFYSEEDAAMFKLRWIE